MIMDTYAYIHPYINTNRHTCIHTYDHRDSNDAAEVGEEGGGYKDLEAHVAVCI